jgi:hypothetical protein
MMFEISLLSACSGGDLNDNRDRLLNIFGIMAPEVRQDSGAFLGRVINGTGKAVAGIDVYVGKDKLAVTNVKGGFLIEDLPSGLHQFYLVGRDQSAAIAIDFQNGVLETRENIPLGETHRVTGKVLLDDDENLAGSLVAIRDSPFHNVTEVDGSYLLDIPAGTHNFQISSRFSNYAVLESEATQIDKDQELNFSLVAFPYPAGHVRVSNEEGLLVRGKTISLEIKTVPGVKYMRIMNSEARGRLAAEEIGNWIKVRDQFDIAVAEAGNLDFEIFFQDALGKVSTPISVITNVVFLDETWTIYLPAKKPGQSIYVGSNEKVALLHLRANGPCVGTVDSAATPVTSKPKPDFGTDGPGLKLEMAYGCVIAKKPRYESDTGHFSTSLRILPSDTVESEATASESVDEAVEMEGFAYENLTAEAGSTIRGGGVFYGDIILRGTKESPVNWLIQRRGETNDLTASSVGISDGSFDAINANILGGRIQLWTIKSHPMNVVDSVLDQTSIAIFAGHSDSDSSINITRSDLLFSSLEFASYNDDAAAHTDGLRTGSGRLSISMTKNNFNPLFISSFCYKRGCRETYDISNLEMKDNNFLNEWPTFRQEMALWILLPPVDPEPADAPFPVIRPILSDNYFKNPDVAVPGQALGEWPVKLGTKLAALIPDAGRH